MALFGGRLWHGSWYLPDRLLPEGHSGHATSSLDGSRVSTRWSFYYIIRRLVWQSEYLWHCGLQSSFYCQIFGSVQELIRISLLILFFFLFFFLLRWRCSEKFKASSFQIGSGWNLAGGIVLQAESEFIYDVILSRWRPWRQQHPRKFSNRDCLTDGQINKCCTLTLVTLWFLPHDAL